MPRKDYYIAYGSVRGSCGHKHKTREAAEKCAERDAKAIRRLYPSTFPTRAYSDRSAVVKIEGGSNGPQNKE